MNCRPLLAIPLVLGCWAPLAGQTEPVPATPRPQPPTPSALVGKPSAFLGSVPSGEATDTEIELTLADALGRALRANLGVIDSGLDAKVAAAQRVRALSELLPQVSGSAFHQTAKISLITFGLTLPGFPILIGPFSFQEGGFTANESLINIAGWRSYRATQESAKAAEFNLDDARATVVIAVGGAYYQVVASQARLATAQALAKASTALESEASDRLKAGLSPAIDSLRAGVQRRTDDQRVLVAEATLAKDRLTLARIIGLPLDQRFRIATKAVYERWHGPDQAAALAIALKDRSDLAGAAAALRSAELARAAASAERFPTLNVAGSLDWAGKTLGTTDTIYTLFAGISLPLYTGGRISAQLAQADATLARRRAEYADFKQRVEADVRNAYLDLGAADSSVVVAHDTINLAVDALTQARDRFTNGVTNDLEVVLAEEQVAAANENYIASLFAHSLAKLEVLRALGQTEQGVHQYLEQPSPNPAPPKPDSGGGQN